MAVVEEDGRQLRHRVVVVRQAAQAAVVEGVEPAHEGLVAHAGGAVRVGVAGHPPAAKRRAQQRGHGAAERVARHAHAVAGVLVQRVGHGRAHPRHDLLVRVQEARVHPAPRAELAVHGLGAEDDVGDEVLDGVRAADRHGQDLVARVHGQEALDVGDVAAFFYLGIRACP